MYNPFEVVYYLPLPDDVGRGNDVVEPRFTLLLFDIVEAFDADFVADLPEWCLDLMHSNTNWSLQPWLWWTDAPQSGFGKFTWLWRHAILARIVRVNYSDCLLLSQWKSGLFVECFIQTSHSKLPWVPTVIVTHRCCWLVFLPLLSWNKDSVMTHRRNLLNRISYNCDANC